MRTCAWLFLALPLLAEKERLPGGKVLPHDRYVHAVSLADAPAERVCIQSKDGSPRMAVQGWQSKDGSSVAAGPCPCLVHFRGAPGGGGIEKLVTWVRGADVGTVPVGRLRGRSR